MTGSATLPLMAEHIEVLEQRIGALRAEVRRAALAGDREHARSLRRELREAQEAWDDALADLADSPPREAGTPAPQPGQPPRALAPGASAGAGRPAPSGAGAGPAGGGLLLPLREQVHQTLTLLTVPAAPRLISAVHQALFAGAIPAARLTSMRRDEERSFRSAPFARPYYLCAALTADLLAPARGLLAISTWPMERRVIGPLSPRVDYLTAAVRIAESVQRIPGPGPAAWRLLWRFAVNIPGAATRPGAVDTAAVIRAARAELEIHAGPDAATRHAAAARARSQLSDAGQLFGSRLRADPQSGATA